jgi:DNA-binding transcriptional regulator LsrR (DeoR family)
MDERLHEQLAQVAVLYYEQEQTQQDIADTLGMSRAKVYRLLKQAREQGVVQIIIDYPVKRDLRLEQALQAVFALKDCLVLKTSRSDQTRSLQRVGQMAARYLEALIESDSTLAICLGRSTYEVINAIRPDVQSRVCVVQAMGGVTAAAEMDSGALARLLARKVDGEVHYLLSPLMADSAEAAQVLRTQREIQRALDTARVADIALVGIGNLDPATSKFVQSGFISAEEMQHLAQDGAVGDIAGQFFTLAGHLHPCPFNHRVIAVTLDDLRQIPLTIAVAVGVEKARAIVGGLRTGALKVLTTDDLTAEAVLGLVMSDE